MHARDLTAVPVGFLRKRRRPAAVRHRPSLISGSGTGGSRNPVSRPAGERGDTAMTTTLRATTIFGVILISLLVGCARRPALTAIGEAPAAPGAAAAASAERPARVDSGQLAVVERQEEIAQRPNPATFAENANVKPIYFDFDRYEIRPGDATTLDADAAWLKTNDLLILIEGQCDERGTVEYNLALGDRRARAAMNYLVSLGVRAGRISTVSYGKERPVCTEHTEACWALNRRAHILVNPRG